MSSKIETYDRKRKNLRGGHLLGYITFFVVFIVRSALKIAGTQAGTLWTVLHVVIAFSLLWLLYFSIRLFKVQREISRDPVLKEALNNELDRLNELKAWKAAFYSLIVFNIVAVYLFHIMDIPLKEPIVLVVTNLLVGTVGFDIARYLLDR